MASASMDGGWFAPLLREEENTLRRIAYGVHRPRDHFTPDVKLLRTLSLVDECDGRLELTTLGRCWISQSAGRHIGTS